MPTKRLSREMLSPEFLDLVSKIQKDAPKSETKDLDFLAIAALIMKFIEMIVSFWKNNRPSTVSKGDLQSFLQGMGFLQRFMMKRKIKQTFGKDVWRDGIFTRTLDEVGSMKYNDLNTIVQRDVKTSL